MSNNLFVSYHYDLLNQNEKNVYELLLNGLKMKNGFIDLISTQSIDFTKVITSLKLDHPELYYVNFNDTFNGNASSLTVSIKYFSDVDEKKLEKVVEKVQNQIKELNDEYDAMVFIHNYVAKNCFAATPKYINHDFDLYGALILHRGLCEGACKAFMYLANQCGLWATTIPCQLGNMNHAINMIRINGEYIYLDIGNDLKRKNLSFKHFGKLCYPYFHHGIGLNLQMLKERQITLNKTYQIIQSEKLNYLIRNKLVFHTLEELRIFFAQSIQKHKFLTIRYDGSFTQKKFIDVVRSLLNQYFKNVKIINLINKTICICGGDLYEG